MIIGKLLILGEGKNDCSNICIPIISDMRVSLSMVQDSMLLAIKPSGWFHIVVNYIGPDEGEGIRIYHNGVEVANATTKIIMMELCHSTVVHTC